MARPVKWSRDLHRIRERATNSRTETWGRKDIEDLFGVGRASAQMLMKAIGEVQPVGGAHFVDRASLLSFLNAMIEAPSVEEGLRRRTLEAEPPPRQKPLRISLPSGLRSIMLPDLPSNIVLGPGRLEIEAPNAVSMLESLATLAMVVQNDLEGFRLAVDVPSHPSEIDDGDLQRLLGNLRARDE